LDNQPVNDSTGRLGVRCRKESPLPKYDVGDYVKVESTNKKTGAPSSAWVLVESSDDKIEAVFGTVVAARGSEPIFDSTGCFDFSTITEHKKGAAFQLASFA